MTPHRSSVMFYSAYTAAHNKFQKDVVPFAAAVLRLDDEKAMAAMTWNDRGLTTYLSVPDAMSALHKDVVDHRNAARAANDVDCTFAEAAAAHVYANSLASVSGLITRWGELDTVLDDSGLHYQWTDLLNYLLTEARETALANIAECRRRDIPCIRPIYHFEMAELCRDDVNEDKVDVLTSYWNASLQAKVLLMLFKPKR